MIPKKSNISILTYKKVLFLKKLQQLHNSYNICEHFFFFVKIDKWNFVRWSFNFIFTHAKDIGPASNN